MLRLRSLRSATWKHPILTFDPTVTWHVTSILNFRKCFGSFLSRSFECRLVRLSASIRFWDSTWGVGSDPPGCGGYRNSPGGGWLIVETSRAWMWKKLCLGHRRKARIYYLLFIIWNVYYLISCLFAMFLFLSLEWLSFVKLHNISRKVVLAWVFRHGGNEVFLQCCAGFFNPRRHRPFRILPRHKGEGLVRPLPLPFRPWLS